ncbi:hypothetical protein [Campylobacter sp.]|uniref:hypothetical protein n=1 Tax=Campylobacter sp. TaxID=205 RepID=UPI0026FAEECE|nr:hypothetical protein [Campylobacter sp.]
MEFLTLVIITICMYLLMFKPEREKLAFCMFGTATFILTGMWFVSTFGSIFGNGNY